MFKTENMSFANIYIYDNQKDKLVDGIIKSEIMHLVNSETINQFLKEKRGVYHYQEDFNIDKIKSKLFDLIQILGIQPDWDVNSDYLNQLIEINLEDKLKEIENLLFTASQYKNQFLSLENDINKYKQMVNQLLILKEGGYQVTPETKFEYLYFRVGKIQKDNYEKIIKEFSNLIVALFPIQAEGEDIYVYLFTIKKNKFKVDEILEKYNFMDIKIEDNVFKVSDSALNELNEKINVSVNEKNKLSEKLEDLKKEHYNFIKDIFFKLKILDLRYKVKKYFVKASNLLLISGWFLAKKKNELIKIIENTVGKNYFMEIFTANELKKLENVPVFFKMPKILEPFKDLTYNYGIPQYKTLNPIPFMALTYLLMFGTMFGDVGQGLFLFLVGWGLSKLKKLAGLKSILKLTMYCGLSSILFGFLFGSIFGYENIIKPLWLRPIDNINILIPLGVGFGVLLISLGIIINVINAFITKDFVTGIFDKFGLLSGFFYWGLLFVVSKIFVLKEPIQYSFVLLVIVLPLLLLFLKEPVLNFIKKRKKLIHENIGLYLMENLIELFDIVISYIANTVSFIRIIAFGLAHAGLFIAVFSILDILKKAGSPGFVNVLVLILGNLGVILLEGLSVAIQAMRLEYYEFFGKFFNKTGIQYQPVKLQ